MISAISPQALQGLDNYIRVAEVEQVVDSNQILVKLSQDKRVFELWVCFAMGNMPLPQVGDRVLVAGENVDGGYIIGHFPAQAVPHQRFSIEQDEASGKTILSVPEGDLDLRSEQGSICLQAAKNIELNSPQFALETAKGEFNIVDASYQGLRLGASIAQTKLFLGKLNTTVGRLIEKAKNVYRQVDNLNQLKAGRMRTLVKGSYHLKSESINQKADKDVRIDGDKINLG
ncbi:DUF3540 domain-containing protein [Paraglaciecola sp.]|uniref:DUF3540 domain-containing protein n=1 Tax=Paraglaciecola sp. TaxID=1920173 RepID=UPI003EF11A21